MEWFKLPTYNTLHIKALNKDLIFYNIKHNQYKMLNYLLGKGAKIYQSYERELMEKIITLDTDPLIIKLITNSIKITFIHSNLIYSEGSHILSLLLNADNCNTSDCKTESLLDIAIKRKEYEIINLLVSFKPIITKRNILNVIEAHIYSEEILNMYKLTENEISNNLLTACKSDNIWFVVYLFENYTIDPNTITTALHYSITNIDLFVFFIQQGALVNKCCGIFHAVVVNPEIVEYLIQEKLYNFRENSLNGPPIFTAIKNRIMNSISLLIQHDPRILNVRNIYGETPLEAAKSSSTPEICENIKLLENKYGVDD